ncbi:MAG: hypothetical protein ACI4CS_02560 [Candidatus Weimeria sp.]
MAENNKIMHVVCLRLHTSDHEGYLIDRSFHALSHIHNVLVKHVRKLIIRLEHDKGYQALRTEYSDFLKKHKNDKKLSKADASYKKDLSDRMKIIRQDIGLSEYSLQSYIKVCAKQYNRLLSSQQVQKEATRIWQSVEKYLFGNGKAVHFKKYQDFDTIGGKSNKNGMRFDKSTFTAVWMGHTYKAKHPKRSSQDYVYEALSSVISYCEVKRCMFPDGWHYYINVTLKGPAPRKLIPGDNHCGIDPGVSTIAAVSDDKVFLEELAPDAKKYNKKIADILYHMDISRRMSNPAKYNPDGTIDKGNHDRWVFSKTYIRLRRQLKSVYRTKSEYIKHSHNAQINRLLEDARYFTIEDMDYSALAKKSKATKRSDKASDVKTKDGTVKQVHKYKRKKRFGKSLNNRAPALFLKVLEQKALTYGGSITKVATKDFCASQYDHSSDSYMKVPLSQREKVIDGHTVQRDLYSAFLILNTDDTLKHPDRDKCISTFGGFVKRHDELISEMKKDNISMKQCFGF